MHPAGEGDAGPSPLKWRETLPYLPFALILCDVLPVLLRCGVWYVAMGLGRVVSELFHLPQITKLLRAVSSTLGIILAVLLYDALLVIISTTLLIVAFRGG